MFGGKTTVSSVFPRRARPPVVGGSSPDAAGGSPRSSCRQTRQLGRLASEGLEAPPCPIGDDQFRREGHGSGSPSHRRDMVGRRVAGPPCLEDFGLVETRVVERLVGVGRPRIAAWPGQAAAAPRRCPGNKTAPTKSPLLACDQEVGSNVRPTLDSVNHLRRFGVRLAVCRP